MNRLFLLLQVDANFYPSKELDLVLHNFLHLLVEDVLYSSLYTPLVCVLMCVSTVLHGVII